MLRMPARRAALAAAALLAFAAPRAVRADELILKNGDRLTGTVIKRENGKIYFHSDLLGELVAPENVVTIVKTPPSPMAQALAGLPPKSPGSPQTVEAVHSLGPLPWLVRPFLILRPVVTKWTGKVEFGYGNELNTSRTITTNLSAEAERNVGPDDIRFKGSYLYASTATVPTTDQDEIDFRWRHNLSERWFTQATTSDSSDKIRLINTDIEQTADIGYKIFATARQTADIGGGAMLQYFDATGVDKGSDYLGNAFQDYSYKINGRYTLTEDATIQYSPEERGRSGFVTDLSTPVNTQSRNYDYKFGATLQGKINNHLSLNLHFQYEYDNAVLDPHARADQHILSTVGYGF